MFGCMDMPPLPVGAPSHQCEQCQRVQLAGQREVHEPWCPTLPPRMPGEWHRRFERAMYDFLSGRTDAADAAELERINRNRVPIAPVRLVPFGAEPWDYAAGECS